MHACNTNYLCQRLSVAGDYFVVVTNVCVASTLILTLGLCVAFVPLSQVPQFILDHMLDANRPGKIVVTQPRRLAAVSVATRVSQERGERLGESVGYHVRLDTRLPSSPASVVFCTTGILLRQLSGSHGLDGVVHVLVDEVRDWENILHPGRVCVKEYVSVHMIAACMSTQSVCVYAVL